MTQTAPKLTKPQQSLLDEVNAKGEVRCVDSYRPAKKLIELDLVTKKVARYGVLVLGKKA